jgi:hypothetical protein
MSSLIGLAAFAFVLVVAFVGTSFLVQSREHLVFLGAAWVVVGTAALMALFGFGQSWTEWSLIGNVVSNALAVACVIGMASVGVLFGRARFERWQQRAAMGVLGGLAGIALSPFVGLAAACGLIGDCI